MHQCGLVSYPENLTRLSIPFKDQAILSNGSTEVLQVR